MNFGLLLAWMSHLASGSWDSFRQAVEELSPPDADVAEEARAARIAMSDLAFADFFIEGSRRWRILPATIGGLCLDRKFALVGARSTALVSAVQSAAERLHIDFQVHAQHDRPSAIELECSKDDAKLIAEEVKVKWSPCLATECAGGFESIERLLDSPLEDPPMNWSVQSLDFATLAWVKQLLPKSACEFSSTYGERRFFVNAGKGKFFEVGKRESVFVSAAMQGVRLVEFDVRDRKLSVPLATPLPEKLARAACLCSGRLATVREGRICYYDVPCCAGGAILAACGQPMPPVAASIPEAAHG